MFAYLAREGRSGRPSCIITLLICGPAMRLQVTDLCFRPLVAFFLIELKSRKVVHVGVTRSPTDAWTAVLATWIIRSKMSVLVMILSLTSPPRYSQIFTKPLVF